MINKILKELEKFGFLKFEGSKIDNIEQKIKMLENQYNFEFPEIYKNFLLNFGSTIYLEIEAYYQPVQKSPWTPKNGLHAIYIFYGFEEDENNLIKIRNGYQDEIFNNVFPIADGNGGNEICIGVKGDFLGKIYFWDHESEENSESLYLISNDFASFINELIMIEDEDDDSDLDGVTLSLPDL